MGAVVIIIPVIGGILWIMLIRGLPRRRQLWLSVFAIAWTAIVIGIGYSVGGIAPEYRGNISIQRLLRDANRSLEAGDCEQARAAFSEANRFVERGGKVHDAVTMIGDRLRPSAAAPANAAQPQ
jgi:hypothetical protein